MACFNRFSGPARWLVFLAVAFAQPIAGAQPRRLTDDGRLKFSPTYVDGGKAVVFSVHDVPNRVSLVKFNLADKKQKLLYPALSQHQFDAAFSADGRYRCFAKSAGGPQLVLVIEDVKQKKEWEFRPVGSRSTVRTPRFMPDNRRIVFTLSAPGGRQIASVDMQGGDLKRLTQSTGSNDGPSVSPDGKRIAFSSSRDGHFQIYVMNADGSGTQRITRSPSRDMRPAWSPDGKQIAFTSARDGNLEVYVMRADGSKVRRVTDHPERDDYPTWHPSGKSLLTVSQREGKFDLYAFDLAAP